MTPEEDLEEFVARSEAFVKELKYLTTRLEKQLEIAKQSEDNYNTFCAMCEFKSILRWGNPIRRYTDKTLRTLPDIDNAFRAKKEKGFECFSI